MYRFARIAVLGAVALAVVAAAACSDDDDGDASGGSGIDALSAINFLDTSGFHGIDVSINDDGEIPGNAATIARKAQAVVNLASWPADLDSEAAALEQIFAEMATELEKEEPDLALAGEHARRAHDGLHDFSTAIWAHLREEAGQEVPDPGDGHD